MIKRYGPWRCRLLAEKVETRQEFLETRKAGFVYFQGYFFRRPELMTAREIPANRLNYLRMLQAVSQPELDPKEIEKDRKSTRLNSSHITISYAVFCLKKKK